MKWIGFVVVFALLGAGCTPPFLRSDPPPKKVESPPPPPPAPPSVLPESVNEKNASESAKALREELDYEAASSKRAAPAEQK